MTQKEFINVDGAITLSDICEETGANRLFLVTGKASYESSGALRLIEKALGERTAYRFSSFSDGPNFEDVLEGVSLFKNQGWSCKIQKIRKRLEKLFTMKKAVLIF